MKRLIPFSTLAVLLVLFMLCGCENDTSNNVDGGGGNFAQLGFGDFSTRVVIRSQLSNQQLNLRRRALS